MTKLFVYGVNSRCPKDLIEDEFGRCGKVEDVYITGKGNISLHNKLDIYHVYHKNKNTTNTSILMIELIVYKHFAGYFNAVSGCL